MDCLEPVGDGPDLMQIAAGIGLGVVIVIALAACVLLSSQ